MNSASSLLRPLAALTLGCLVSLPLLHAADTPAAPAKPHTLFMGADFAVEWKGQLRPVRDVQGSSFVIDVDGARVVVPADKTDLRIKMDNNLKLTARAASVDRFQVERSYTPANDPHTKFEHAAAYAMDATAATDVAAADMRTAQSMTGLVLGSPPTGPGAAETIAQAVGNQVSAENSYARSVDAGFSSGNNMANHISRLASELAEQNFDAFTLTADISSPRPLHDPYVVLVTRYRRDEKTKESRLWIYAQALPQVGPKPEKIRVVRGGFPPGYQLDEVTFHLYDGQTEIATNVSRKRVPLTTDEAFEYSLVEYLVQNKDKTTSPSPARAYWPLDLFDRAPGGKTGQTYYAKVSPSGKVSGLFTDPACTQTLDAAIASALTDLRFYPALAKGKAIDGTVAIKL